MDSKKIIGALLASAAVGAAIGILLAPSSGEKTRTKLMKGTRKLTDDLQTTVEESIESLKDKFNSSVDEIAKKGAEMLNHASERVWIN
jgi:gas vesicle protein